MPYLDMVISETLRLCRPRKYCGQTVHKLTYLDIALSEYHKQKADGEPYLDKVISATLGSCPPGKYCGQTLHKVTHLDIALSEYHRQTLDAKP